jgi:hypothetical protein
VQRQLRGPDGRDRAGLRECVAGRQPTSFCHGSRRVASYHHAGWHSVPRTAPAMPLGGGVMDLTLGSTVWVPVSDVTASQQKLHAKGIRPHESWHRSRLTRRTHHGSLRPVLQHHPDLPNHPMEPQSAGGSRTGRPADPRFAPNDSHIRGHPAHCAPSATPGFAINRLSNSLSKSTVTIFI